MPRAKQVPSLKKTIRLCPSIEVTVLLYTPLPVPGTIVVVGWDLEEEGDDLVEINNLNGLAHIVRLEVCTQGWNEQLN